MRGRRAEVSAIAPSPAVGSGRCLRLLAAWVGVTAMLGVCVGATAQENYGRLFFSAEERRMMDDARNDYVEPQQVKVTPGETQAAPVVDVISFDGKVERSGKGGSTIWVNGRPVLAGSRTVEGISVNPGRGTNAETLFVLPPSDAGETNFSLKVGQKIAVQSGKVLDSYEARAAEEAESVFAKQAPAVEAPPAPGANGPAQAGASAAPKAPGGS
jgi:hypothetical protein